MYKLIKIVLLFTGLFFLVSCATQTKRAPSSEEVLTSVDPGSTMEGYLKQLAEGYYRGYAMLKEFDAELDTVVIAAGDSSVNIFSMHSYLKLQALRSILHELREKIVQSYFDILEVRKTAEKGTPEWIASHEALKSFNNFLRKSVYSEVLALAPLVEDIKNVNRLMASSKRKDKSKSVDDLQALLSEKQMKKFEFSNSGTLKKFIATADYKKHLEEAAANLASSSELADEVNKLASSIEDSYMPGSRGLDSVAKISPSVARSGNITGSEFPSNTWAITFDDGPSSRLTPKLLEVLEETKSPATLFVLTQQAKALPAVVSAAKKLGVPIASHSYTHANLGKSSANLNKEITQAVTELEAITGEPVKFFRLPYGNGVNTASVRQKIAEKGMIHVFWNVDTLDWQDPNPDSIYERTKKQMKSMGRGVILFHDIHSQSIAAATRLYKELSKDGITRLVSLPQITQEINESK